MGARVLHAPLLIEKRLIDADALQKEEGCNSQ